MISFTPEIEQTAAQVEQYIEAHLFDPHGLMYSGIDAETGLPYPKEAVSSVHVPRRADINPWAYWTYEDTMMSMGLYLDGLMRKFLVTRDKACFARANKLWLAIKNCYFASQVYGIGSFLRPYGGFEGMNQFVEPLGTDQASPLLSGLYLYRKVIDRESRPDITEVMLRTLNWYELQGFRYFYYKCFIHDWTPEWQHAGSYYLPAIAFALDITSDQKWHGYFHDRLPRFGTEEYDVYHSFIWGSDLPMLEDLLGGRFHASFTRRVLDRGYALCQQDLATYTEPGHTRRVHAESALPGFEPYVKAFDRAGEHMGLAASATVHGAREHPRHEINFLCALAMLRYPGAGEEAVRLLEARRHVPFDFTAYCYEDHAQLPDTVRLYAQSVGVGLVEWYRNYWMLRGVPVR